jgi:glycosyltransferase involved in cell wall biosynthesis
VSYNPFEEQIFHKAELEEYQKNNWRLVYFSHPSKGLKPALEVLKVLRECDTRFHLEIYGGNQLWGLQEQAIEQVEGVTYSGLIGQADLAKRLLGCSFCVNLQERLEPGALVIFEAMRAGCIMLASPVGCFPEYIQDGRDGFLVHGSPDDPATHQRTADVIEKLILNHALSDYVRENARGILWDDVTVARTWMDHWRWFLAGEDLGALHSLQSDPGCNICGGSMLGLTDGYHCARCGHYQRGLRSAFTDLGGETLPVASQQAMEETSE